MTDSFRLRLFEKKLKYIRFLKRTDDEMKNDKSKCYLCHLNALNGYANIKKNKRNGTEAPFEKHVFKAKPPEPDLKFR